MSENSTNLTAWNGYPPTTTTDVVYYGPNPYRDNMLPWVYVPSTTVYWGVMAEKSFKEKIQDLRNDLKKYEEGLDELAALLQDALELVNRRRRPTSSNDTQDGMKT